MSAAVVNCVRSWKAYKEKKKVCVFVFFFPQIFGWIAWISGLTQLKKGQIPNEIM